MISESRPTVHGSADETAIVNETEDGRTRHRRPPERKMAGIADTAATPRRKVPETTTAPHSVGSGWTTCAGKAKGAANGPNGQRRRAMMIAGRRHQLQRSPPLTPATEPRPERHATRTDASQPGLDPSPDLACGTMENGG